MREGFAMRLFAHFYVVYTECKLYKSHSETVEACSCINYCTDYPIPKQGMLLCSGSEIGYQCRVQLPRTWGNAVSR